MLRSAISLWVPPFPNRSTTRWRRASGCWPSALSGASVPASWPDRIDRFSKSGASFPRAVFVFKRAAHKRTQRARSGRERGCPFWSDVRSLGWSRVGGPSPVSGIVRKPILFCVRREGVHFDTAPGAPGSDPAGMEIYPETRRIGDRRSARPDGSGAVSSCARREGHITSAIDLADRIWFLSRKQRTRIFQR